MSCKVQICPPPKSYKRTEDFHVVRRELSSILSVKVQNTRGQGGGSWQAKTLRPQAIESICPFSIFIYLFFSIYPCLDPQSSAPDPHQTTRLDPRQSISIFLIFSRFKWSLQRFRQLLIVFPRRFLVFLLLFLFLLFKKPT